MQKWGKWPDMRQVASGQTRGQWPDARQVARHEASSWTPGKWLDMRQVAGHEARPDSSGPEHWGPKHQILIIRGRLTYVLSSRYFIYLFECLTGGSWPLHKLVQGFFHKATDHGLCWEAGVLQCRQYTQYNLIYIKTTEQAIPAISKAWCLVAGGCLLGGESQYIASWKFDLCTDIVAI